MRPVRRPFRVVLEKEFIFFVFGRQKQVKKAENDRFVSFQSTETENSNGHRF